MHIIINYLLNATYYCCSVRFRNERYNDGFKEVYGIRVSLTIVLAVVDYDNYDYDEMLWGYIL